jgi:acyl-CoA thioester hydrolase
VEKSSHSLSSIVSFSDTDASGWVHFSKVLVFAENAEHDFLKSSGIDVIDREKGGWPRVKITCEYKLPLKFQDEIETRLFLDHIGGSSLVWKFEIMKNGDQLAARGEMVTVKVSSLGAATAISDAERKILEEAQ